jgi:hypothetical protein
MTLEQAMEKARIESLNGYVQHVNKSSHAYLGGQPAKDYVVSDWYDFELTVASFENGVKK